MTIKNQGGIFGRNPTFNNVSVDGSLSIGGSLVPSPSDITTLSTNQTLTGDKTFSGNVGIGAVPNATHKLNVLGTPRFTSAAGTGYALVQLGESSTATNNWHFGSEGNGTFRFYNGNLNAGALKLMLDSSGNLVMNSGSGIDFSATAGTGTSELFDDYEEGSWTPEIKVGNTGSAIGVIVYEATYTKVGRLVFVEFRVGRNDASALSGNVTWNLPFASGNATYFPSGSFWNDNTGVSGFVNVNSYANAICNGRTVAGSQLTFADYANGQSLVVSLVYQST